MNYDVIVVGGGHAGCEAAVASANMGKKTLLITMDMTKFAQMSCNPAMGGIAKGQIVREIDALGGYSGIVTDKSTIQFRMLNKSKGPAMWSPRAQCDRFIFSHEWRKKLEANSNILFRQDSVTGLIIENDKVVGVVTKLNNKIYAKAIILTTGTFEKGLIHVGEQNFEGGRMGDQASYGISECLKRFGFTVDRMKTGTPARIDGRSIDFTNIDVQHGDEINEISKFSYLPKTEDSLPQHCCYIVHTSQEVHDILESGFDKSPLFTGTIQGRGPRYCPSIEDKIKTFSEKDSHLLFLEPEGIDNIEFYLNGFSSSLPEEVQLKALRKIKGFESVEIFRPGYAIEYDYYDPTQLKPSLETKKVKNLFFAGQINGTTGYEEAAAQGLMAGINAALKIDDKKEFILGRDESYIGVLIDDLVTKGVDEPYRMFTSRAEYRILLRQDNADERLTPKAYELGLVDEYRMKLLKEKQEARKQITDFIKEKSIKPEYANEMLERKNTAPLNQKVKLESLLLRPQVNIEDLESSHRGLRSEIKKLEERKLEILESAEIEIKYKGYIEREKQAADKLHRLEDVKLSDDLDYNQFQSISNEARQKLNKIKPKTIGQAKRISGVSPADINVLLVYLGR